MKTHIQNFLNLRISKLAAVFVVLGFALITTGIVYADVPDRKPVSGSVPNPGTQQQELANITFPAPYNVFEFVVTCGACHSGTVDQNAGHFANWAGSSMASAARDPVFRANQIGVNNLVESLTGENGAGNMCFRCHSPNGWYSGRFDPSLGGDPEGRTMLHSILASTDDEGIMCEFCHRVIGAVTMQRTDLDPTDPVWNLLGGLSDWPHTGGAYIDQDGDPTIAPGNPYGDTTLQLNDGMTYVGKYSGSVDIYFSDLPFDGSSYTGQTYAVYPWWWTGPKNPVPAGMPQFNSAGQELAYAPDGSLPIHFEAPIGPPIDPATGNYDYQAQGLSLEHPTVGDRPGGLLPSTVPPANDFIRSSEFCGACHDLTVPVLNHGMPEQRTYTEWKYSDFNTDSTRCQDCHMPTLKHEYADDTPVSVNADPTLAGWFPYTKDRNADGGTSFHKFAGANLDLSAMMTVLYPEVDLEVIGAPTGNDTRIFPGMLSDRSTMWDRNRRNTEITLVDAVNAEILGGPTFNTTTGKWEVQVKVTNTAGHRIPSGYPDGRRFWINLQIKDINGNVVYESGYYNQEEAALYTDATQTSFQRALTPFIDSANNAVMVYERATGTCLDVNGAAIFPNPAAGDPVACNGSPALTNNFILFDNRIPPAGFSYAEYRISGVKFWNYDPATLVPFEDATRYPDGQNWDIVTYSFDADPNATLSARAEILWQTHTREFMEHLKTQDTSTVRPEGPPSIYDPNYPLTPNYLSDVINLDQITDLNGNPLRDNWGGIAYAAWLLTGKGAPYIAAVDDSTSATPPAAPANVAATPVDPFTLRVTWDTVPDAEGYLVWIRYGLSDETASWDKFAIVYQDLDPSTPQWEVLSEALNIGKSYTYKVQAFNGKGYSADSALVIGQTPTDLPLPPEGLLLMDTTATSASLSWVDIADNEIGFVLQRQDVPVIGNFYEVTRIASPNGTGTGGVNWTDTTAAPNTCYNYRVAAYNAVGDSTYSLPVQACTMSAPTGPITLNGAPFGPSQIDLAWSSANGIIVGYRVERSEDGGLSWPTVYNVANPAAVGTSDILVQPNTTYWYRVFAYNQAGDSPASNTVSVTTPDVQPAAPTDLAGVANSATQVTLTWTDNADNELGFSVERCADAGCTNFAPVGTTGSNVTTYTDLSVSPGSTYLFRVFAYNGTGNSLVPSNEISVTTPALPGLYFSTTGNSALPGVDTPDDADIYTWNGSNFGRLFDASAFGLLDIANIDGLDIVNANHFYVSFSTEETLLPRLGTVQDEDVVYFNSGVWSVYFDGGAAGLLNANQDLDAFDVDTVGGILYFSTFGNDTVPGVPAPYDDADIYAWNGTSFSRVYDASVAGLPTNANVDGLVYNDAAHFSVSFSATDTNLPGLGNVQDEDVAYNNNGTWTIYFDGTAVGLTATGHDLDAFFLGTVMVPPTAPIDLTAIVEPTTLQVFLNWKDTSNNELGFTVERCTGVGCTDFVPLGSTGVDVATYTDATVALNESYTYRVYSFNADGNSLMMSNEVVIVVTPPLVPTLYFSTVSGGTSNPIPGVDGPFDDADIYTWDGTAFGRVFDASAVGLSSSANIDGLVYEDVAHFYLSFSLDTNVPTLGTVQDEDVVYYNNGVWSVYFDGTARGLTGAGQDLDAIAIANGILYFSTLGSGLANPIPGVAGPYDDADIYTWNGTTFGRFFDASVAWLLNNANVDGIVVVDATHFYLSFSADTALPAFGTVQDEDVVYYETGTWTVYFDGTLAGLTNSGHDVDAFALP